MPAGVTVKVTCGDVKRRFVAPSYSKLQETSQKLFGPGCTLTTRDGQALVPGVFTAAKKEGRLLDITATRGEGEMPCTPVTRPRPTAKDFKAAAQAERLRWMREKLGELEDDTHEGQDKKKPTSVHKKQSEEWDSDDSDNEDNEEEEVECVLKLKSYKPTEVAKPLATVSQSKARSLTKTLKPKAEPKVKTDKPTSAVSAVTAALTAAAAGTECYDDDDDDEEDEEEEEEDDSESDSDSDSSSDSDSEGASEGAENAKESETLTIPLRSAGSSSSKSTVRQGRAQVPHYEEDPLIEFLLCENERLSRQVALLQQERFRPSRASSQPPKANSWEAQGPHRAPSPHKSAYDNPYEAYTAAYFD
eukprot:TRINITY_DN46832_c0_g1_i1.p1 TRINITY_DN46832_c0_g1~~TRINITY_DN46832_c0_g1_i1.p1  ORF type:complete len:374 (+),score=89.09 TRINITY_DN46832_c0_g1_i1:40-1122(+)